MKAGAARIVAALGFVLTPLASVARDEKAGLLTFEAAGEGDKVTGWDGGPRDTLFLDDKVVHSGARAGRIERGPDRRDQFSSFTLSLPIDFAGEKLELRGWLKVEGVSEHAGLWQRQDGATATALQFDNMASRGLKGTSDWTEYSVVLPLHPEARTVFFGALLAGSGRVWVDDLQLLVDGRPLAAAPIREVPKTVLDTDTEFDAGSKIELTAGLTSEQIENLATLAKVWGFLKYHHPRVVKGELHWDYELFRVVPRLLAAKSRTDALEATRQWVRGLGEVPKCNPCAESPAPDAPMKPRLDWLKDVHQLGDALSADLRQIHANRLVVDQQFFVSFQRGVRNPEFSREPAYAAIKGLPDAGYRLLALFRYWNIIEYWFPYRDVMEEDWDAALRELLPRVASASTREEYELAMMAMVARVHDGHAFLATAARPPRGECMAPVRVRFVDDLLVVDAYMHATRGPATGLEVGDVVRSIGGEPVEALLKSWRPYFGASHESAFRRQASAVLLKGTCGPVSVVAERAGKILELTVERAPLKDLDRGPRWNDQPGDTFRRLSDDLAYLKLSTAKNAEAADYIRRAQGAKCLVLDLRNYPEFVVFSLGPHLFAQEMPVALFTRADPANPGSFVWTEPTVLKPAEPRFEGRLAILVDEVSISRAEYLAMIFRSVPRAIVVGGTTAGADGNFSAMQLPGGLRTGISGIGVFWPDKRPTQRIGIAPDVVARPTIAGLRAGEDEVLDAAVNAVLGRRMNDAERKALRPAAAAAAAPAAP